MFELFLCVTIVFIGFIFVKISLTHLSESLIQLININAVSPRNKIMALKVVRLIRGNVEFDYSLKFESLGVHVIDIYNVRVCNEI